jgi:hypothetical protein
MKKFNGGTVSGLAGWRWLINHSHKALWLEPDGPPAQLPMSSLPGLQLDTSNFIEKSKKI